MTRLQEPRFEGSIRLSDGRQLGFAEYGPATGRAMLWFHGTPGARRQIHPEARALADTENVRLIAVERPGIGYSTPHEYEAIVDWVADIEQLLYSLGIDRFGVVGLSGGGPYALACAHQLPERVVGTVVLGGVAPAVGEDAALGGVSGLIKATAPLFSLIKSPLGTVTRGFVFAMQPFASQAIDLFAAAMPPGDQRVFEDPDVRFMFEEDLLIGAKDHMQAIFHDTVLFGRDWGFALDEIEVPVYLRYGDSDNIVPAEHGEHLAERIPSATLRIISGEGHLGGLGATKEIFASIFSDWHEPAVKASTR